MPYEDRDSYPSLSPRPDAALLTWRRCARCGSVSYAPPGVTCQLLGYTRLAGGQVVRADGGRCGGELSRPPGWKTMIAPRWANGEPCVLEYYR